MRAGTWTPQLFRRELSSKISILSRHEVFIAEGRVRAPLGEKLIDLGRRLMPPQRYPEQEPHSCHDAVCGYECSPRPRSNAAGSGADCPRPAVSGERLRKAAKRLQATDVAPHMPPLLSGFMLGAKLGDGVDNSLRDSPLVPL